MPAKLYKVGIAFDVYVVAETPTDAINVAEESAADEISNQSRGDIADTCTEINAVTAIDPAWRETLPYLGDDIEDDDEELTCEQHLERIIAGQRPADLPGQGKLFEEANPSA